MTITSYAHFVEPFDELVRIRLFCVACNDYAADVQVYASECVDKAKHVKIVRYSEVAADFVLFDVVCVDDD